MLTELGGKRNVVFPKSKGSLRSNKKYNVVFLEEKGSGRAFEVLNLNITQTDKIKSDLPLF